MNTRNRIDWIVISRTSYGVDELLDGTFAVVSTGPSQRDESGEEGITWARHGIYPDREAAAISANRLANP